jgi:MFS family permease
MAAMAISLGSIVVLPTFALIVAAGVIGGAGSGFVFIPWLLLIQHHSSDAVRGRVVAAAEAFDQISFLAGMVAAVAVISITNPHHAYALTGLLLAAATLITAVSSPPSRSRKGSRDDNRQRNPAWIDGRSRGKRSSLSISSM